MSFAPGALVRARGREWVVQPGGDDELVMVRPLGGTEDETTGIYTPIEAVAPATFPPPDPAKPGDFRSCRLLRDAVRLGFRSSAGPFRSFASIAVEPRPYQLVPLLMALKQDPVRLLIADDVGIGKTIEAALIARELRDRGEIRRLAVLCPPHLAEQWQRELLRKFHLDATLVIASTARRLERDLMYGQTIFDVHDIVVISLDFIKSDKHRFDFFRTCPEFVIVDEAHTCVTAADDRRSTRHQRYELVRHLADDPDRHLVLVTATPHSGNEAAFRALLGLLKPEFADLPTDLSGKENERLRQTLAAHVVMRKRPDIRAYLDAVTTFPIRLEKEEGYKLSPAYKELFRKVLAYARETVRDQTTGSHRQRVQWWAVLGLLRALASSPAAAAATLRARAATLASNDPAEADAIGRRQVLDLDSSDAEAIDTVPGADTEDEGADTNSAAHRRLLAFAREAEQLQGAEHDAKLATVKGHVAQLLKEGANPIVFCRFINTAEYVAAFLRQAFPKITVAAVTGMLTPDEREERVAQLGAAERRILVCTDCLSEGINLQEWFDAVVHYDLSWNPTRHEQREGRVDRFGQKQPQVRLLTYYGLDNQIDGIVLEVLLRKYQSIRKLLGVSVPVPADTNQVIEAVMEGLILKGDDDGLDNLERLLPGLEEYVRPQRELLEQAWANATDREKRSRSIFAQQTIKVDDVAREVAAMRACLGTPLDVRTFLADVLRQHQATIAPGRNNQTVTIDLTSVPLPVREAMGLFDGTRKLVASFDPTAADRDPACRYLVRTDPIVAGLAAHVLDTALDPLLDGIAHRCGVMRTGAVTTRTTVLVIRSRFHIATRRQAAETRTLAEDCYHLAFTGSPAAANWLGDDAANQLLQAMPDANVIPEQVQAQLTRTMAELPAIQPHLDQVARDRAAALLEANHRVRQSARERGVQLNVEPLLPSDVLGVYVLLPVT